MGLFTSRTSFHNLALFTFIVAFLSACSLPDESATTNEDSIAHPVSKADYAELDNEVGCNSKYIDEKKDDLFNTRYMNHWMTWTGEVVAAHPDSVSLNMDSKGIQDLQVTFAAPKAGYDIIIGSVIAVKFVMKSAGGCIFPFTGNSATIAR